MQPTLKLADMLLTAGCVQGCPALTPGHQYRISPQSPCFPGRTCMYLLPHNRPGDYTWSGDVWVRLTRGGISGGSGGSGGAGRQVRINPRHLIRLP